MNPSDVALVMIVRNEEKVIRRAVESAKPYVGDFVIIDTGSTDRTIDTLESMGVYPFVRPWVNFGHNRTELFSIATMHTQCPWLLTLDADAVVSGDLPEAGGDVIMCDNWLHECRYPRPTFFRNIGIKWVGVLHEYPDCTGLEVTKSSGNFATRHLQDGARCHDPNKFKKDAALLEALPVKTNRDTFYLAQSYRDAKEDAAALHWYETRVFMGGWAEECFVAQLEAARCKERLAEADCAIVEAYWQAFKMRPIRAEPLCELARFYRLNEDFHRAFVYAHAATSIKQPPGDVLFIDTGVYNWRALDELGLAAFYIGRKNLARQVFGHMLESCNMPQVQRTRVEKNLELCG